ncbi:zinc ribbon domain-containing protein [Deinococcus pimensis]|uniref:zinc ribbon domain-containing protein n=1 Tax=Deinococcus pimensis TaxID=309888 RepID=UPI000485D2E0|nr:zinc ribbon domain-containing protein [Deinococcus pimensis]
MNESGPLERLYRVQQFDLELDRLHDEELRVPDGLREAREEQERVNNDLEDAEIELEGVERSIRQLESDLASTRDQIARARSEQEKNAFDPKAQTQYQNRIQQLEDRVTETDEGLAPLYERRTTLEGRRGALRGQHGTLRPRIADLEQQDEARVEGLRAQGEGARREREEMVSALDSRLVKEYELIRRSKKGLGIVPVEAGRCTGCNMQLPVTVQQRVATGRLPAVKCPSCGRFLVKL